MKKFFVARTSFWKALQGLEESTGEFELVVTGFACKGGTAKALKAAGLPPYGVLEFIRNWPKQLCVARRVWQILPSPSRGLQNDS